MYVPIYNKSAGLYGGLKEMLGDITLGGDERELFFSYEFSKEKSNLLYRSQKDPLAIFFLYGFQKTS